MDLVELVRHSTREVAVTARWVTVDPVGLAAFADTLLRDGSLVGGRTGGSSSTSDDPWWVGDVQDAERRAAWVLTLATINFGSGWHDVLRKGPGRSGAITVAGAWRAGAESAGLLDPRNLSEVDTATMRSLFDQPDDGPGGTVTTLMEHFAAALREMGEVVCRRFHGRFLTLAATGEGSAVALAETLATLPQFADRATHEGADVFFYKRAQLAAADVHRAFAGDTTTRDPVGVPAAESPGPLRDVGRLTAFADNLVPHVLRIEGVLRYDPALLARIDRGELLEPGGTQEVEIRAAGVHAVELLVADLRYRGITINAADLDAVLWRRGGSPPFKAEPRHRCRTIYY